MNTYTLATHTFALDTAVTVAGLAALKGSTPDALDAITGGDHLTVESALSVASIDVMPSITTGSMLVGADAPTYYGTVAGTQGYIHAVTFSATSKPTLTQVASMLAIRSLAIDMRLRAAGYTLPVADADGLTVLATVAELHVAASIIERLVLGAAPDAAKVESAATWRKEADALLQALIDGSASMPGGDDRTGGAVAGIATGSSTAFPREDTDDFIDAYRVT